MSHKISTKEGLLEVIDALPLSISVIDKNRVVALANKATLKYVSKKDTELVGHIGGEAFGCANHDDTEEGCGFGPECTRCTLRQTLLDAMEKKNFKKMIETVMNFKNMGKRDIRISTSPIFIGSEEMVLLTIEDITESKIHEQTKLKKEKFAAVLETAGAICHEFNQPLQIIYGYCDLLKEEPETNPEMRESLDTIVQNIERLGDLNNKLMRITKYKTKGYLKSKILDLEKSTDTK